MPKLPAEMSIDTEDPTGYHEGLKPMYQQLLVVFWRAIAAIV